MTAITTAAPSRRPVSRQRRRATSRSSNGRRRSPIVWVVSWPLPAMTTTSPGRRRRCAARDRRRRSGSTMTLSAVRRRDAADDVIDDRRRGLGARVVGRDDHEVGEPGGDGAHLRTLGRDRGRRRTRTRRSPAAAGDVPRGGEHLARARRACGRSRRPRRSRTLRTRRPLEAPGHRRRGGEAGGDRRRGSTPSAAAVVAAASEFITLNARRAATSTRSPRHVNAWRSAVDLDVGGVGGARTAPSRSAPRRAAAGRGGRRR